MIADALPPLAAILVAALFGLIFGSFLNVCIVRWGAEPKQSVVRPPSRCPRCGTGLRPWDNIPVVSWLLLRGKCRSCGLPISPMYPLVELATAVIWAYSAWRYGISLGALQHALFLTILLGIALTDLRRFVIPDEFSLGGLVLLAVLGLALGTETLTQSVRGAGFGAGIVVLLGVVGTVAFQQEAMGGGDVKLMGLVGLVLGTGGAGATLLVGAAVSLLLVLLGLALASAHGRSPQKSQASSEVVGDGPRIGRAIALALILALPVFGLMYFGLLTAAAEIAEEALIWIGVGALLLGFISWLIPATQVSTLWLLPLAAIGASHAHVGWPVSLAIGAIIAFTLALVQRRRSGAGGEGDDQSQDSAADLKDAGYIPFGVGLSIAAAIVLEFRVAERVRELLML